MFGIEFAPLFIPLERRLQTLTIIYYIIEFLPVGIFAWIGLITLLFTPFYMISLVYFMWYWYDYNTCSTGGRLNSFMRHLKVWEYFVSYFPIKLISLEKLSADKNYIFGLHPHGILCFGAFGCFGTEGAGWSKLFPNIKPALLTIEAQFRFPIHREIFMASGK